MDDCCAALSVPGGAFNRGNDEDAPASVSTFSLDKFEVTVGRFRKFTEAFRQDMIAEGSGRNPNDPNSTGWDSEWNARLPLDQNALVAEITACQGATFTTDATDGDIKPVNCVSWEMAQAFCVWDGGRLPAEAEWNYAAAGGSEQRIYPWSNPPTSTSITAQQAVFGVSSPAGVGVKTGAGKWGHFDLAGNVGEWVSDYNSATYLVPCNDCEVHEVDRYRVYRGGSYQHPSDGLKTPFRAFIDAPSTVYIGFRCARL